jgi:hypothetical protein
MGKRGEKRPAKGANPLAGARACAGSRRRVQVVRQGKRKLFDASAKALFLEWFAVTCNVRFSAEQAGITPKTVFRHRMKDRAFHDAWEQALDSGYARIEAKIIETMIEAKPIEIDGELDVPELEIRDPAVFQAMLKEHRLRGEREAGLRPHKPFGPKLKRPSEDEVLRELVKRLHVFGIRMRGEKGAGGAADRQS